MKRLPDRNAGPAFVARFNGCSPFFWKPFGLYCCGCDDNLHGCDQQSSVIDEESAKRTRADGPLR